MYSLCECKITHISFASWQVIEKFVASSLQVTVPTKQTAKFFQREMFITRINCEIAIWNIQFYFIYILNGIAKRFVMKNKINCYKENEINKMKKKSFK